MENLFGVKFYYKLEDTYDIYIFITEKKAHEFAKEYLEAQTKWEEVECLSQLVARIKAKKIFNPIFKKYAPYYKAIENIKPEEISWNKYTWKFGVSELEVLIVENLDYSC